jgi:hypothetical protein
VSIQTERGRATSAAGTQHIFTVQDVCEPTSDEINDALNNLANQLNTAVAPALRNFEKETGKKIDKIKCGSTGPVTVQCENPLNWDVEKTSGLEAGFTAGVLGVLEDKSHLYWGRAISGTKGQLQTHVLDSSTDLPSSTTPVELLSSTELHYNSDVTASSPTSDHIMIIDDGNCQIVGVINGNLTMKGAVALSTTPGNNAHALWTSDDRIVICTKDTTNLAIIVDASDPNSPTEEHIILAADSGLERANAVSMNAAETVLYFAGRNGVESWNWGVPTDAPTVGTYHDTGARIFDALGYSEDDNLLIGMEQTSTSNIYLNTYDIQTTDSSVFTLNSSYSVSGTYSSNAVIREISVSRNATEVGVAAYWQTFNDGGVYLFDASDPAAVTLLETVDATATTNTFYRFATLQNPGTDGSGRIWTIPGPDAPVELYKPNNQNWIIPCQLEISRINFTLTDPPCADVRVIEGIPASHGIITNLDSDLLDGQEGAYYLDHGNHSGLDDDDHPQYLLRQIVNGTFKESFDALVTSDGATVTMAIEKSGGGDLTYQFSDGVGTFASDTIALTAGSDASPTDNYIYVLQSTKALTKSTSDWPTAEHIKVGYFLVPSAGFVQTNGVYINQNWNDHLVDGNNQGHIPHMAERSRRLGAIYYSGIDGNGTDDYLTPGVGTTDLKATSGVIYQMHKHTVPAFDTAGGDIAHVVNWFGDAYHDITDLFDITDDSTGSAIGVNKYFNLVIWAVANKSGEYSPMMINLPAGSYNTQSAAENDTSSFDNFSIPAAFNRESSTGFLIARITVRMGATWTVVSTTDLRGLSPSTASGGTPSGTTEFADNVFKVFDESDVTKILALQCSGITTGNTRTLTIPDASGTIELEGHTHTPTFDDDEFLIQDETDNTKKVAFRCNSITTGNTRVVTIPDSDGLISYDGHTHDDLYCGRGYIDGLILSNAADTDHDITVSEGCADRTLGVFSGIYELSSGITKQIDAAWAEGTNQGGLATGSVAANTHYNVIMIVKDSDGTVDIMFDVTSAGDDAPSGWTSVRRIGSVFTDASSNIRQFSQWGDRFRFEPGIYDLGDATGTPGTFETATVRVPGGQVGLFFVLAVVGGTNTPRFRIRDTASSTADGTTDQVYGSGQNEVQRAIGGRVEFRVDSSRQLDYTITGAGASVTWTRADIYTHGWTDDRGRNS